MGGIMMHYWGRFANATTNEDPFYQEIHSGNAFVIQEGTEMETEEIPMEKCDFLACVPDLYKYSTKGEMTDDGCMRFAEAAAVKNVPLSILMLIFSTVLVNFFIGC